MGFIVTQTRPQKEPAGYNREWNVVDYVNEKKINDDINWISQGKPVNMGPVPAKKLQYKYFYLLIFWELQGIQNNCFYRFVVH